MNPIIQVCGDPTMDWLSVRNSDSIEKGGIYFWTAEMSVPNVGLGSQPGGSVLLLELIDTLMKNNSNVQVQGKKLDGRLLNEPINNRITNSWTAWKVYMDKGKNNAVFRLCEWQGCEHGRWAYEDNRLTGKANLLVIEDSGIAFRDIEEGWPEALSDEDKYPECILYKLAKYGGDARSTESQKGGGDKQSGQNQNLLLSRINNIGLAEKTTIVTALSDLRACPVKIGTSLSWEMLFEEIVDAIYSPVCPFIDQESKGLKYARVIVTVGTCGAVVVSPDNEALVFDREGQEDDFSNRREGEVMGYNTCVMGALAARWVENRDSMDWCETTRDGMGLARFLHLEGYSVVTEGSEGAKRSKLQFPFESISCEYHAISSDKRDKKSKAWNLGIYRTGKGGVRALADTGGWSILEQSVKSSNDGCNGVSDTMNDVIGCAEKIVVSGPESALPGIPIEAVGNWRSADRHEIEGVRSVNNAIRNYLKDKNQSIPLCIAVFGPPGAGKSFAIKEIAKALDIDKDLQLTFNLSQFTSTDELSAAFHQIRDLNLKGKKPLVFWDEFDTPFGDKKLGWLKYFLAPMQDGEFTEHGRVHPIGGGIFVFAGATCQCFNDFCDGMSQDEISAKKPDFISRLKAYIDVKGPNGMPNTIIDKLFIIRRAFLLHTFLNSYAKNIKGKEGLSVERGALEAYLRVNKYKHGARSMETLIKMSSLNSKRKYELSSLPPKQILDMHVNATDFLSLTKYGHLDSLRIGITGHIGLNPDHLPQIEMCISRAINFIEKQYPCRAFTVFSPLALGADRLVARMLLKKEEAGLIAVLPVPKDEYINDFGATDDHNMRTIGYKSCKGNIDNEYRKFMQLKCVNAYEDAEMRQEFKYWLAEKAIEVIEMPPTATRNEAYLKMGLFVAENSDLLFAVWDGREAQGTGGTGAIVQKAIDCGKPVIHVWAGNYKEDPSKRTDVGDMLGKFRYINISSNDNWCE